MVKNQHPLKTLIFEAEQDKLNCIFIINKHKRSNKCHQKLPK